MPSSECSRRFLLRATGLLAVAPTVGCLRTGESETAVADTTATITTTSDQNESDVQYYDFGQWYDEGETRFTVTDWGLYSSFRRDGDDARYELRDEQLLAANAKVRNTSDEATGLSAPYFAAVTDGNVYRERGTVDHPQLPDQISIGDLRRVERATRWSPQSARVEPHSIRDFAIICLVPEKVTLDALEIGYERSEGGTRYPVRWVPE